MDDDDVKVLAALRAAGRLSPGQVAKLLGVARMTGYRRLNALVAARVLKRTAARGRDVAYVLAPVHKTWKRNGLDEDVAWQALAATVQAQWALAKDDQDALHYVFTEMVNNAVDHSGGTKVSATIESDEGRMRLVIVDDGIGAFERVRSARQLDSVDDAALQIEKGKQTTMPERHSGEGLFFSSKVSETFRLEANGRAWLVQGDDSTLERTAWRSGTKVTAWFTPGQVPKLESVFGKYTDDDGAFSKTKTTVKLAEVGDAFLSRSQARRVAAGLDKFKHVTLDFHGVARVGQGFVDELFRVFARAHPGITLEPVRMSDDVRFMITRSVPLAPAEATDLAQAFAAMEPAPVLRARALIDAARSITDASARGVLSTRALRLLVHEQDARLAVLVRDVDAVLREDDRVALADAVLQRITATPKLWRWFVDDDAIDRFFAEHGALWGSPL
jgi:anti-sigma regulatory factor (Ser/Thr protein kinase)